jgi:hypothetical protein
VLKIKGMNRPRTSRFLTTTSALALALGAAIVAGCAGTTPPAQSAQAHADSACVGLADARHRSILGDDARIVRVAAKSAEIQRPYHHVPIGADVAILAEDGVTPAYLERRARCEVAQNAALGAQSPTYSAESPLAVEDVSVSVRSAGPTHVVELRSDSPSNARDVEKRARALAAR